MSASAAGERRWIGCPSQGRIDTFIRLAGALEAAPNDLVAGILWTPAEAIVTPGGFEVPDDPELTAEVAALREAR
jgi:hypothetical protein